MTTGILITNGGPHPADKWAEATAAQIVEIAEHVAGEKRAAAVKLQAAIIDILIDHHTKVQIGERGKIAEIGHDRLGHDLDPSHHLTLDEVIGQIVAAAKGTAWQADLATEDAKTYLSLLLRSHFATSMRDERSWHADRNPTAPETGTFRATYHPGV